MNYLVLALGNPGTEYQTTRHNAGWIVLDAGYPDLVWDENEYAQALVAHDGDITFAKPQTFMNLSGETVRYFMDKEGLAPDHLVVIYDDIDLPLGTVRISYDRGSGGHNGIKSIESHVGARTFIRIRVGISKKLEDVELVKPNVLGKCEPDELNQLTDLGSKLHQVITTITREGYEKAMNTFNAL